MPSAYACNKFFVLKSMESKILFEDSKYPKFLKYLSMPKVSSPNIEDNLPADAILLKCIYHNLSWACANPNPNKLSSKESAIIVGIPYLSLVILIS